MNASHLSLAALLLYFAVACGGRIAWHRHRTGKTGLLGLAGARGSIGWWSGVLFVASAVVAFAGSTLDVAGVARPLFSSHWSLAIGLVAATVGTLGTVVSQSNMGASWRIGVRETERTSLVTTGLFAIVRNPIFSFLLVAMTGVALISPNAVTLFALALFVIAVELHVRLVEEPYLRRVHTTRYAEYCTRVGRFVPSFGRSSL
jgi:protein-S-isoprenylcysteine O-methyltransferase Ste14